MEVFGEAGRHARSAVGSVSLPLNVATEVEAVIELEESVRYSCLESMRYDFYCRYAAKLLSS